MWEGFGQATEAEKNWKFDVEGALELLPQLVEQEDILWINLLHKLNIYAKEDILWINLLHKLNIYAKEDPRVMEYTQICIGEQ